MRRSRDFYASRCDLMQELQSELPEPYRRIVCNVLANGSFHSNSRLTAKEAVADYSQEFPVDPTSDGKPREDER